MMQNGKPQNVTEPDFRKKFFSGRKCRKYAGKTGFLAFSRDFLISFFYFFAQKYVLAMPIIKHDLKLSIKLIFESGTFEKSPEKPIFAGKTVFFEFFELYFIFFHEILHTDAKWQYLKCDGAQFSKNNFSGWKCRKCSGKTGFLAFSRDFLISFFWYIEQKSYGPAVEKDFFYGRKCRKSPFLQIFIGFFPYITLFVHIKYCW